MTIPTAADVDAAVKKPSARENDNKAIIDIPLLKTLLKNIVSSIGSAITGDVPVGGTTGQVLTKASNANLDADWEDVPSGEIDPVALAALGVPLPSNFTEFSVPSVQDGNFVDATQTQPPLNVATMQPVLAGSGAGNLSNGGYRYKVTYTTLDFNYAVGETTGSAPSLLVTVVDHSANGKVIIPNLVDTIGIVGNCTIQGANIYRTEADGAVYKLVGPYNDADFTDNVADADLGVVIPNTNTASMLDGVAVNHSGIFDPGSPCFNYQYNFELQGYPDPISKLGVGSVVAFTVNSWNNVAGSDFQNLATFKMYPAYAGRPARIEIASDKFNVDYYGNIVTAGSITPAKSVVFPDADPHVAGAGYWVAGVLTKSAG